MCRYRLDPLPTALPKMDIVGNNGGSVRIMMHKPTDIISVALSHDAHCRGQERAGRALSGWCSLWGYGPASEGSRVCAELAARGVHDGQAEVMLSAPSAVVAWRRSGRRKPFGGCRWAGEVSRPQPLNPCENFEIFLCKNFLQTRREHQRRPHSGACLALPVIG